MAAFNRVILLGNITREIDLQYTPNQTAVTKRNDAKLQQVAQVSAFFYEAI